jgi:hypothetical protein
MGRGMRKVLGPAASGSLYPHKWAVIFFHTTTAEVSKIILSPKNINICARSTKHMTSSSNFWLVSMCSEPQSVGMWLTLECGLILALEQRSANNQPTIRAELIICAGDLNKCKRDMVLAVAFDQISKSELPTDI